MTGLLPEHAPLSTMRVITGSSWDIMGSASAGKSCAGEEEKCPSNASTSSTSSVSNNNEFEVVHTPEGEELINADSVAENTENNENNENNETVDGDNTANTSSIRALSCVLRLGRKDALTDHQAVLFDVNIDQGVIGRGTVNHNWYQIGVFHHNIIIHGLCYLYWNILRNWIPGGIWSFLDGLSFRGWSFHSFVMEQASRLSKISLNDLNYTHHPDVDASAAPIMGQSIPELKAALDIVTKYVYMMIVLCCFLICVGTD